MPYSEWLPLIQPPWLQREWGGKLMKVIGQAADDERELVTEATKARMPGVGPSDALPVIGDERQIIRGASEADDDYAERLRTAWTAWELAGSHRGLLSQLRAIGYEDAYIVQRNALRTHYDDPLVTEVIDYDIGSYFWTFDSRPERWYNQFGIVFPADEPDLTWDEMTGIFSEDAVRVNTLARQWKPGKAMFFGTWILLTGPVWGNFIPTERLWNDDNWGTGGSRFIPPPPR
jgi:hypothetical protein